MTAFAPAARDPHSVRNLDIEVLRGIAILLVMYAHIGGHITFPFNPAFYGRIRNIVSPGTGVDLFLCISGYVITRFLLMEYPREKAKGSFYVFALPFWVRRFWRLVPSAWFWALFMLLCARFFNHSGAFGDYRNLLKDVYSIFFQTANFRLDACYNQRLPSPCGMLSHYWSLSLEEQFYWLFPFVMFFLPRRFWPGFFSLLVVVQLFLPRDGTPWQTHWTTLTKTDTLAYGVLIALLQAGSRQYALSEPLFLSAPWRQRLWLAVWVAWIATLAAPKVEFVTFSTGLVAMASACLVWTASFNRGYVCPPGILRSVLLYVGSRSYALYLTHIPTASLVAEILTRIYGAEVPPMCYWLEYVLTFAFAELNFRYLETPLRQYGVRVANRMKARAAALEAAPAVDN